MRVKALLTGVFSLLIAGSLFAGVSVTAEDGAKLRVDAAKFAKIAEAAIREAAPNAAVNVSIVIGKPEVLLHKSAVAGSPRTLLEVVRARYTITAANGAMLESVPFILGVSHDGTLERQFAAMHETAGYIAARVAEVTR